MPLKQFTVEDRTQVDCKPYHSPLLPLQFQRRGVWEGAPQLTQTKLGEQLWVRLWLGPVACPLLRSSGSSAQSRTVLWSRCWVEEKLYCPINPNHARPSPGPAGSRKYPLPWGGRGMLSRKQCSHRDLTTGLRCGRGSPSSPLAKQKDNATFYLWPLWELQALQTEAY